MLKITKAQLESALEVGVKAATAVLSVPATWQVAAQAFSDLGGWLRVVVQVAAVVLVEGVLIARWIHLERRSKDSVDEKIVDTISVWVMYGMLLAVAVLHGEGFAGWVFRVAFGLALFRSTYSTLSVSARKAREAVEDGDKQPLRVRMVERRLDIQEQIAKRQAKNAVRLAEVGRYEDVELRRVELERESKLQDLDRRLGSDGFHNGASNGKQPSWGKSSTTKIIPAGGNS